MSLSPINVKLLNQHLETAPKDILGQFPRLTRDGVLNMIRERHPKLGGGRGGRNKIPSLMDMNVNKPQDGEEGRSYSSPDEGMFRLHQFHPKISY